MPREVMAEGAGGRTGMARAGGDPTPPDRESHRDRAEGIQCISNLFSADCINHGVWLRQAKPGVERT
jgi:hypothetical protein